MSCENKDTSTRVVDDNSQNIKRPNILLITVDDMGYSDLGAFGGEIATPNIDSIIESGVMLTNFHSAPSCSPTRAMLMSGTYSHLAGLGTMGEALPGFPHLQGLPGYEGYLNERVVPLPRLMKDAGYRTYMTGKWHLGKTEETSPHARGFDETFVLLGGGAGSFTDLADVDPAIYRKNGELVNYPNGEYTTEFYTNTMIDFLRKDAQSDAPFFAFVSYTAPHWPLQAPAESIALYKGKYDAGYEALFDARLAKQKELGIVAQDVTGPDLPPTSKRWNELTDEEKKLSAKKMEIYAAMVHDVDVYIGKLVKELKDTGEFENTVIFFMSDNGAQPTLRIGNFPELVKSCCDNSYENLGSATSYIEVGDNWARASSSPSRLFKYNTTQGGILVPAFISYPKSAAKGVRSDEFLSVMDVLPTFLDFAKTEHPGTNYNGKEVLPVTGKSMTAILEDETAEIHGENFAMGSELFGNKALRQGDWKVVFTPSRVSQSKWQLFNVKKDPSELNDLSEQEPERFATMLALFEQFEKDNGVAPAFPPRAKKGDK